MSLVLDFVGLATLPSSGLDHLATVAVAAYCLKIIQALLWRLAQLVMRDLTQGQRHKRRVLPHIVVEQPVRYLCYSDLPLIHPGQIMAKPDRTIPVGIKH